MTGAEALLERATLLDAATREASDMLAEIAEKNQLRAVVFRAVKGPRSPYQVHKKELDEMFSCVPQLPALVRQDQARMLAGKNPVFIDELWRRCGADIDALSVAFNLRTTVGADFLCNVLSNATQPTPADWIALSNNTNAAAAGDSSATLPWSAGTATDVAASGTSQEYTGLGLARKLATYAHTTSTALYTMSATWTATGAATSMRLAGLFGGSAKNAQANNANNILFLESAFTATTLATNDQLSLTWTVNV